MPSQQEVRWSQLKVGVIVLVSSIVLVTLLFLMTSSAGLGVFSRKLTITTYFENSAGLKDGAPVNLQGVTIGTVKTVTIDNSPERKLTPVKVVMKINEKFAQDLKKDTKASLSTVGVLGDTVIDLNSQFAVGPKLEDGDMVKTTETPSLTDVVKASQGTIESLNVILAKVNALVDTIQSGKGTIGQLINNPDMYNKVNATLDGIQTLERNLNSGKGSVGKLLKDETLYNNLNSTLAHANSILAQADAGQGGLGLMLKDPKFRNDLSNTLSQISALTSGINEGRGTLGKLVTDDQAYANVNKLLEASTDLVKTIRADPKKYLTIHLKIF